MNSTHNPNTLRRIAIIGGSGLQTLNNFDIKEVINRSTEWGEPSSPVYRGYLENNEIFFMPRHGGEQAIPPHKINYRANITVLEQLGIESILAFNAVGGITATYGSGVLAVPDQIVDYTWGREHTFWSDKNGDLLHVEFTHPYDQDLRNELLSSARKLNIALQNGGVYGATQGPRLESAAEIVRLQRDGCDIVGMTGMPEAALAREKNIAYACLALVVNPAAGKSTELISMDDIRAVMAEGIPRAQQVLSASTTALMARP